MVTWFWSFVLYLQMTLFLFASVTTCDSNRKLNVSNFQIFFHQIIISLRYVNWIRILSKGKRLLCTTQLFVKHWICIIWNRPQYGCFWSSQDNWFWKVFSLVGYQLFKSQWILQFCHQFSYFIQCWTTYFTGNTRERWKEPSLCLILYWN